MDTTIDLLTQQIVSTPGTVGGKPRIAGRRITVADVGIWHEQMKMPVEEIVREYDLTLGQIYAALSYYFDHQEEIDRRIAEGNAFVEEMRAKTPSLLQQKLRDEQ